MTLLQNYTAHARGWRHVLILIVLIALVSGCSAGDQPEVAETPPRQPAAGEPGHDQPIDLIPTPVLEPKGAGQTEPNAVPSLEEPPPSADLSPEQLLALAFDQRRAGEPRPMAATLEQLLQHSLAPDVRRRAEFHLAEARLMAGDADGAVEFLHPLIAEPVRDDWHARAHFLLARAYEMAGEHQLAISTYQAYRELNALLAPYAARREAAQHAALGNAAAQLATLEDAATQPVAPTAQAAALERLIEIYGERGDINAQLMRFEELLQLARRPDYRASLFLRGARLAQSSGDQERAATWVAALVEQHPESAEALAAVEMLETLGIPPDPYTAGQISFAHEQYVSAVAWFDQALAGQMAPEHRLDARRLRALAVRSLGDFEQALAELEAIASGDDLPGRRQAELDYIQTVGQSGNRPWAITGYRRFAANYHDDPLAPEALWRAIQLEEPQDPASAMAAALDLGRLFRSTEQAHLALRRAAQFYRARDELPEAIRAWQMLGEGARGWQSAEGHFWAAMTLLEGGEHAGGLEQMRLALAAAPESYYAIRAREFLGEVTEGDDLVGAGTTEVERAAVNQWLSDWVQKDLPAVDEGWLPDIVNSHEVLRARELALLGLRSEAREEWIAALERWSDDPAHLWQLALLADLEHEPAIAIRAAERVVALSPAGRITLDTPTGLLKLLFPTPYARLTRQESSTFGIDPRLLYAVVRQESRFSPDATSWAGARGLGQVMPGTAAGIAAELGMGDFDPALLYRPSISLRFSAFYLGRQYRAFNQSIQAAAAAYNGGPGNAARWLEQSSHPDRFTELIDYRETREYVKIVYGNWGMYRMLYAGDTSD